MTFSTLRISMEVSLPTFSNPICSMAVTRVVTMRWGSVATTP